MKTKQINLKIPKNLLLAAESYAKNFGFRNVQELATASMREKVFNENKFDETFSEKEINLIDGLIEKQVKKGKISSEKEINEILKK